MIVDSASLVVSSPEALADFRQGLSGDRAVDLLRQAGGRLLITLPVGVGKTRFLIRTIEYMMNTGDEAPDLVIVLLPRRDILNEIVQSLSAECPRVILEPRPRSRCAELDARWHEYETNGSGLLAREELCRICPARPECNWPEQYSSARLQGARLVFATQQHMVIYPGLVSRLRQLAGAERVLVLLDESDLLVRAVRHTIARDGLERFITAQETVAQSRSARRSQAEITWLRLSQMVASASTTDLREGNWRFPRFDNDWALAVQRAGRDLYGTGFRFIAHELASFSRSDAVSRERTAGGELAYANPTQLGDNFIVFSGTVATGLARYRLAPDHRRPALFSPFENHRFGHPETRWYNIRSLEGAEKYFSGNASVILDFFAEKIARNIREGRRTLLVAKKRFRGLCANYLTRRLVDLGAGTVRVVMRDWDAADLTSPSVLPLVNYGISGVNRFEDFECVYCLSGYYVSAGTIADAVQDLAATPDRFPIEIQIRGNPRRRVATVALPDSRETILPQLARWTLEQKEDDVVIQAVGRVRPFTRPREVITFHLGDLPGVDYDFDFESLRQARSHFGIATRRQSDLEVNVARAAHLKLLGLTKAGIAAEMGVSRSAIKRYLRFSREAAGGQEAS